MHAGLDHLNPVRQAPVAIWRNDRSHRRAYYRAMAKPHHDWFLKEWLKQLGKRQTDVVKDLGWNKARISLMVNLKQPYERDALNQLAEYLNLKPHELLMHPEDAMALRQLRGAAVQIVRVARPNEDDDKLTGTNG